MSVAREIEERAASWLARREETAWSETDQAGLEAWLAESMAHKAAYWRLEHGWRKADRIAALGRPIAPVRRWSAVLYPVAIAASLLLALVAVMRLGPGLADQAAPQRIATAVGARKIVPLEDGSRIELNTATRLRAAITRDKREIWLDQGEAFFEVVHSPDHPFVVYAGPRTVTVLGTKFSVRREGDAVTVTVLEGHVRIDDATKPVVGGIATSSSTVSTGDVAIARGGSMLVAAETTEKVEAALAWRDGMLTFDKVTLAEVAAEFNRYNRVQLVIEDKATAAIPIGGTFKAGEAEAFVHLLHDAYGLKFRRDAGQIKISG